MAENERIFLAEDDPQVGPLTVRFLERAGHVVVFQAEDKEAALKGVQTACKLGVTVGVLDANLTKDDYTCNDGRALATALRKAVSGIKIVSFSSLDTDYGDIKVSKQTQEGYNPYAELVKAVTTIPPQNTY